MRELGTRRSAQALCLGLVCLLVGLTSVSQALAAEEPPYEFSAQLSLTGDCTTSKADPIADPGCPTKKPPKPFTKPQGIAIDSFGDEYVASYGAEEGKQGRIDIFSPAGVFIGEVKDELGPKTLAVDSKGVLYTFEQSPGHQPEFARYKPTVYKPAEEKIEYGSRESIAAESGPSEGGIAIDSNDHVFVDWPAIGIKEYSSAAEGNELKATITNEKLQFSVFIALDKQRRRLYASSCPTGKTSECWVLVFNADAPHELLKEVKGPKGPESKEIFKSHKGWMSIAVDEENGDFFVGDLEQTKNVYQFDSQYEPVSTLAINPELFEGGEALQIALSNAKGAANETFLFVPSLKNRALAFSPPAEPPAKVKSFSVTGIGEEEAELLATLEPKGGEAHYVFEYLSQQEYEEAGNSFTGAKVAGEGTIEPAEQEAEVSAAISGLQAGTEYRARISIENGTGGETKEASFATYSDAPITSECPEAIRTSYSTLLPDCRAYELVTPADTNGRPPRGVGFVGDRFATYESSPSGNAVSFLTEGGVIPGLGGTGSLNGDLYHVARTEGGWQTTSAGPTGAETTSVNEGSTSPDQGYSFWVATREGSAVIGGEETHYVRYPDGHSELIGRGEVEGEERTDPLALGKLITQGGTHIVFQTRAINGKQPQQLADDAPPTGTTAVYDRIVNEAGEEETKVVSLLPGDETPKAGEDAKYVGASADGKGIAFTIGSTLYLRVNDATTYEIGSGLTFAGLSEEGRRIFYTQGGDLRAFDVASEAVIDFTATGNAVPVNVSPDGSRAYFASTTAITGSGENPRGAAALAPAKGTGTLASGSQSVTGVSESEGSFAPGMAISGTGIPAGTTITAVDEAAHTLTLSQKATASGAQALSAIAWNLYLSEEGEVIRFVGTVSERDVVGEDPGNGQIDGLGLWTLALKVAQPAKDPSRLNPSGSVLLFSSRADLTGYAHEGVPEIYRYDSAGETLACISCIPTKTPASGGASLQSFDINQGEPPPFSPSGFVQSLRADGKRAIFESTEALVSRDNDGLRDVYEWEEAGVGSCSRPGGCIYLISSGHSAKDNFLYATSASGDDVFFTTSDVLAGGDNDTVSIYDARVNGGFEEAVEEPCQGESCHHELTPPPPLPEPGQPALGAEDNVKPLHCPKGKRKAMRHGKEVCVKKHHRKKHHKRGHAKKKGAGK